jgi:peroxiredoxin
VLRLTPAARTLILSAALALAAVGCGKRSADQPPRPAPDFSFVAFDGMPFSRERLGGRPVVLFFWVADSAECADTASALVPIFHEYSPKGLQLIGVATKGSNEDIREAARGLDLPFAIANSPDTALAYRVQVLPTTVFISARSEILSVMEGPASQEELEAELKRLFP